MSSFVKHELKIQIDVVKNKEIDIRNIETIVESDENQNIKKFMKENNEDQKIEKFMKENDQDQNNEKFIKKDKINSREADWDSAINKINENLLKAIW